MSAEDVHRALPGRAGVSPCKPPLGTQGAECDVHERADSSGELLLVFTQVAAQDPKREFVLGVRVPDSNIFEGERAADVFLAYGCSCSLAGSDVSAALLIYWLECSWRCALPSTFKALCTDAQ